jgi:hypothetical protein
MNRKSLRTWAVAAFVSLVGIQVVGLAGQSTTQTLGSVRITQNVTANGQPLAPGTYTLRLSDQAVTPVVGQSPEAARWVEFVQGGQVRGRELASVIAPADVKEVAEMPPPAPGASKVQTLKGADYLRLWVNRGGTQYLIHLGVAGK